MWSTHRGSPPHARTITAMTEPVATLRGVRKSVGSGSAQRVLLNGVDLDLRAGTLTPVVAADEPTGKLDEQSGEGVLLLLRDIADAGQAVLLVTHDVAASALADRVLTLKDGRLA